MATVFGRDSNGHLLEPALRDSENGAEDEKAMAWNFRHDWRVSTRREEALHEQQLIATAADLRNRLDEYFKTRVRFRDYEPGISPDFENEEMNGSNRVRRRINSDWLLITIIDVGGLHGVFDRALSDRRTKDAFSELAEKLTPRPRRLEDLVQKLDDFLRPDNPENLNHWARVFINVLVSQAGSPFHPTWASTLSVFANAVGPEPGLWQKMRGLITDTWAVEKQKQIIRDAPAERWMQLTGIPKKAPAYSNGTWLMALCYPAMHARPLYRPTMLDGPWFPEHFPSPQAAGLQGHPMNLQPSTPGRCLIPEFIHPQLQCKEEHFLALKRLPAPVEPDDLLGIRTSHWELLCNEYRTTFAARPTA